MDRLLIFNEFKEKSLAVPEARGHCLSRGIKRVLLIKTLKVLLTPTLDTL